MGSVYRRKNSKNWWIKYYRNGKPYSETSGTDIKSVAQRLLKRREGEIAQGKVPGVVYDRITFDELADDFLTDYRVNEKKSLVKAEHSVEVLKKEFGGMKATAITTASIKRYISRRQQEEASKATINRELAALKRMYKLGSISTPAKVAQVPHIPMLMEDNVRTGFFEHGKFLELLGHLPEYLRPVSFFAYCSGWRKGEILSLQWDQIDLTQGIVRLNPGTTKNKEGRTLYMEPRLWQMMRGLHAQNEIKKKEKDPTHSSFVFNLMGKKIGSFRKTWQTACKKAGIPGMLFHDFRRTAVRDMVRAGIPERVVMTISGHKTRSVFDRYNIVSAEDLSQAAYKRQEYRDQQEQQLQFSYTEPKNEKGVVAFQSTTP
jgi:integrase